MSVLRSKLFIAFLGLSIFLLHPAWVSGQKKSVLQRQKEGIEKRIKEADAILKETETRKKAGLGQLSALNIKMKAQTELLDLLRSETKGLSEEIGFKKGVISALESDLEALRKEYAKMVYITQKSAGQHQEMAFLFSAESFRDFFIRLEYLKQYSHARNKQIKAISAVVADLETQRTELRGTLRKKTALLQKEEKERGSLIRLQQKRKRMIAKLSKKARELTKDIKKYKRDRKRLEKLIAEVVRKEIANRKRSKKVVSVAGKSFVKLRKNLPWPVEKGFISSKFGKHPHPVLKNITIRNQGVDIQTSGQEPVKAVHAGVVKSIAVVPGAMKNVVIVQHGDFFTVYAKLADVKVRRGDKVGRGQTLGVVSTDSSGKSEVQFQVWNNQKNLNPEAWLKAKR